MISRNVLYCCIKQDKKQEIFDTLTETGEDYKTAVAKLDEYFLPKKNVDYETFQFRQASQKSDETVDQFVTRLRKLAVHCEFADLERELKSAVIEHCTSKRLRRHALREEAMTLDKLLSKAQALEASETQAKGIEESTAQTNPSAESVKHIRRGQHPRRPIQVSARHKSSQCRQCGLSWPHTRTPCPAKGKTCNSCGKPNHFAKMCLSGRRTAPAHSQYRQEQRPKRTAPNRRQVNHVSTAPPQDEEEESSEESSSDGEYIFTLGQETGKTGVPETSVKVNGVLTKMMIDTGASTDVLDEAAFQKIDQVQPIQLADVTYPIFPYGSQSRLRVLGKFKANITANGKQITANTHVLEGTHGSLLSFATASKLGLVEVKINNITTFTCSDLIQQYPTVFQGIGNLKSCEVKLHIDETVPPVAQSARRIPFHLRKKVSAELEKLEQEGIIERVEGPTPWVSPLVVIPKKNGDVRLCVDMRMPNQAIQRERHPSPTVDDLVDVQLMPSMERQYSPSLICVQAIISCHWLQKADTSPHLQPMKV